MLGSAELRARLGARFWAQLKIGWGWGLVVQLGLAQGSVLLTGSARGSGLGSGICAQLGSEPSSTHLGSELYSEFALVRLSSGLELGSCGTGKKC